MDYVQKASIISKKEELSCVARTQPLLFYIHNVCQPLSYSTHFLTSCGLLKFLLWPLLSGHLYSAPNIKGSWDKVFFKGHCELNERMDFQLAVIINVSFTFALWTFAYNQSVNLRLEVISHFLNKPIYSALQKSSAICNLCFAFEEPDFLLMLKQCWAIVLKAFRRSFIVFLWTSFFYSLLVQSLLLTFFVTT